MAITTHITLHRLSMLRLLSNENVNGISDILNSIFNISRSGNRDKNLRTIKDLRLPTDRLSPTRSSYLN